MFAFAKACSEFFVYAQCEACSCLFAYSHRAVHAKIALDDKGLGDVRERLLSAAKERTSWEIHHGDVGHVACPDCGYTQSWMGPHSIRSWQLNTALFACVFILTMGLCSPLTDPSDVGVAITLFVCLPGSFIGFWIGYLLGARIATARGIPNGKWFEQHRSWKTPPVRTPLLCSERQKIRGVKWVQQRSGSAGAVPCMAGAIALAVTLSILARFCLSLLC